MQITLKELRKMIREEVERNMRWSAGFFGGGIDGAGHKGDPLLPTGTNPLPGLGSEDEEETYGKEEQEELEQPGARAATRPR
jgi:hypothetical protein